MKNLESNISDKQFPDEYIKRARKLVYEYEKSLEDYRKNLSSFNGRDDRMNPVQKKLTAKLRQDISELRKAYNLNS